MIHTKRKICKVEPRESLKKNTRRIVEKKVAWRHDLKEHERESLKKNTLEWRHDLKEHEHDYD
jgi:hypothetical protein